MIKKGDKGTIYDRPARVIADDLKAENPVVLVATNEYGKEYLAQRKTDGTAPGVAPFIPSKPWNSLKPTDPCFVRDNAKSEWMPRVFAGQDAGIPLTFGIPGRRKTQWVQCIPAKLIDGELIPVEDE